MTTEFGAKLRSLRLERRLNQKRLAADADIDVTYLSKVETGRMDPPSEETVRRLAEALDVEPTELLILAKKIPADVREIVTASPEVSYFLRTARAENWGPDQWRILERKAKQKSLFDGEDDATNERV